MNFSDRHLKYIQACAECRALEIAAQTGRYQDKEDYQQDILLFILRHADAYNPARGTPKTYIAMLAHTAMQRVFRKMNRKKNRIISNAISIP